MAPQSGSGPPETRAPASAATGAGAEIEGGGHDPKLNIADPALSAQVFRIVIADDPFGHRVIVSVEPRVVTRPSVEFRTEAEATEYAEQLSKIEGWPVLDRREYTGEVPA